MALQGSRGLARRYAWLFALAALPLVLLVIGLAVVQFQSQREAFLQGLARSVDERRLALDAVFKAAHDHVLQMKRAAEDELSGTLPPTVSPLRLHLAPRRDGEEPGVVAGVFLDDARNAPWRARTGNLLGVPDLLERRGRDPRELDMALGLMDKMRLAHQATPFLRWSYYFSASRDFIIMFPFAESRELNAGTGAAPMQDFLDAWLAYDVFRDGTPARNPERRDYWTPIYLDAGGAGWMVSHGAPVYDGDRFYGIVGTDILLDYLDQFLERTAVPPTAAWIVNDRGEVLATGEGALRATEDVPLLADRAPRELAALPMAELLAPSSAFREVGGWYLLAQRVESAPWTLLTAVRSSDVDQEILPRFRPYAIIVLALVLTLALGQWLLQRLFVAPAMALGDRIRAESGGHAGRPQPAMRPTLPGMWQPLFAAVDAAFAAHRELATLNARFMAATESFPDGLAIFDAEDRFVFFNRRYPQHLTENLRSVLALGKRFEDWIREGLAIGPIYHPAMGADFAERRLGLRRAPTSEHEHLLIDGRWMRLRESRMANGGRVLLTTDITARKAAEEALARSEARFLAAAEALPDGLAIFDAEDRLVYYNSRFPTYLMPNMRAVLQLGRRLSDMLEEALEAGPIYHPDMGEDFIARRLAFRAREATDHEQHLADGRWLRVRENRMPDAGRVTLVADVTQRRAEREALETQTRKLEAVLDNIAEGVNIIDQDGRVVLANPGFLEIYGFPPELAQPGATLEAFVRHRIAEGELPPGETPAAVDELVRRRVEHFLATPSETFEETSPDGRLILVRRQRLPDGFLISTYSDVTELRRRERELAMLARAVEQAGDSVEVTTPDYRLIYVNPAFTKLTGWTREEAIGRKPGALVRSGVHDEAFYQEIDATTRRGEVWSGRLISRHKDGHLLHQDAVISPVFDEQGRLAHFVAVKRDVGEREQAAAALRASEERYRAVVEAQTEFVVRQRPDGTLTFANDAYCRYMGMTREQMVDAGYNDLDVLNDDDRRRVLEHFQRLTPAHPTEVIDLEPQLPGGRYRVEQWTDTGIFDADGRLVEVQGIGRDVTEQRLAERALRASEARYRAVVEGQTEFILRLTPDGILTFVNDAYCRYRGLAREQLLAGFDDVSHYAPEDQAVIRGAWAGLTQERPTTTYQIRKEQPDGSVGYEQWTDTALFDLQGRVVEIQSVGRDITEQRRAEEALRASEARFRAVVQDQTELIGRFDADFKLTFANEAQCRIVGKSEAEMLGLDFFATVPERLREELRARMLALTPENPVDYGENEKMLPSGEERWYAWTNRALFDESGRVIGYQSVGRDITEQKRAEQALKDSEARLAQFMQNAPVGMYVKDLDGRYVMANPEMAKVFGRPVDTVIGQPVEEVLRTADATMVREYDRELIEKGVPTVKEEYLEGLEAYAWSMVIRFPIRDASGRIVQIGGFDVDITPQKRVEQQLKESQARFRLIAEGVPVTVVITRFDAPEVLFANARQIETFGSFEGHDAERIAATWERLEDRAELFARVARDGRVDGFETELHRADGTRFNALISARSMQYDGAPAVLMAVTDITEQRRMEQKVRESEARLAAFLQNAPVAMYLKDLDGRYVLANREMGKVFGRPSEEMLGRTAADTTVGHDLELVMQSDEQVLRTGRPLVVEEHAPDLGAYRWSMVIRFPLRGQGGAITHIGGFHVDITPQKRAEEEIVRQREALYQSEKMAALGSLLAGVAHELNNPLSVVVGYSAMLEELAPDEGSRKRAERVHAAAERCARIVKTFLAMARQKPPQRGPVAINGVVEAALELAAYGLRTAGIEVVRDLAPDPPPVWGDADQLHQVLANLVINAQHALEQIPPPRRLTVTTRPAGRHVTVIVGDNGPGMSEEVRKRIFEPFFTTKPQGMGTGVGLSLCHAVVGAHDGSIEVETSPGNGARFLVALPVAAGDAAAAASLPVAAPLPAPARVLVVDDEPEIAELVAEALAKDRIEVVTAASGREALARLERDAFDLVISDLRMPDVDGPALWRELARLRPALADRFLFVTGDTLGVEVNRFLRETALPVMEKPLDLEELRRHVGERLRAA